MSAPDVAPSHTALLVIDIQVDFAAPDGEMARQGADLTAIAPAVAKANALVTAARAAGVPCIFSHVVAPDGAVGLTGTPGVDFVAPLPRADERVVAKRRYSVFAHNDLAATLRRQGIDTLVLCGLTTECCVQSTAWGAFEHDFRVVIATDAVAAYRQDLHQAALAALELSGAILVPTAQLVAGWK